MTDDLLYYDVRSEHYKGVIHLVGFAFATVCAAYNLGAALVRPSSRLATQAAMYAALAVHEAVQVRKHWTGSA